VEEITPLIATLISVAAGILGIGVGFKFGFSYRKKVAETKIKSAEDEAQRILVQAEKDVEARKKIAIVEARDEMHKERTELEREIKERRAELSKQERRVMQKDETLEKKIEGLEKKEEQIQQKMADAALVQEEVDRLKKMQLTQLEKIASLTAEEAKTLMLKELEGEIRHDAAMLIKNIESEAKEEGEKRAKYIVAGAIQRCAADHSAETTVSVVNLPSDDMKGRIIGREGRNIRALETLTGIDLIIDDTPEAVILSGFDPIRREIARMSLEKLITDGRIHPTRIEETVEKSRKEIEAIIKQEGEQAVLDTGVVGVHPELVKLLGRLRYRTSYGQNVLKHSLEVAHLAGLMAAELGADVTLAKRAGLLHDIGKALDHEMEGSHIALGAEVAKKYKENNEVVHAILAHHGDIEATTLIACLVQAADAISAARPGARRENLETYIKRLQKLEEIASSFEGVDRTFAIQAGREIRIMVKPEEVNDDNTIIIAREIVKKIEKELEYPGQIKVNVIRELRAIDYAK